MGILKCTVGDGWNMHIPTPYISKTHPHLIRNRVEPPTSAV